MVQVLPHGNGFDFRLDGGAWAGSGLGLRHGNELLQPLHKGGVVHTLEEVIIIIVVIIIVINIIKRPV